MARKSPSATPWLAWWELGLRQWEMLAASGQVIGLRSSRMVRAGANPSTRDRREFTRMGAEKVAAAQRSALAMAAQAQSAWWRMAMQAWQPWLAVSRAGLALVHRAATANARRLTRAEFGARRSR